MVRVVLQARHRSGSRPSAPATGTIQLQPEALSKLAQRRNCRPCGSPNTVKKSVSSTGANGSTPNCSTT
ncbi:hypothetical protein D3C84_1142440 [compost metagenome]